MVVAAGSAAALALITGCAHTRAGRSKPDSSQSTAELNAKLEERVDALAHFAAGVSDELNEKPKEATGEFLQSALADLGNEALVLDVGRRLIREQKNEQAVELLNKAAAQQPASGNLYALLGLAYVQSGQTNQAVEANQQAILKSPDNVAAYQNLAALQMQAGRTNEALLVIEQATSRTNASPEFLIGMIDVLGRYGRQQIIPEAEVKAKTLRLLDQASAQETENPLIEQRIGDLYVIHGQPTKAEPIYAKLFQKYPNIPGLRERLANIYIRNDKNDQAAKLLEEIRRENPTEPSTYFYLGSIAYEAKDYDKAAENYQTALRLNPDFEPLYYDLAGVDIARQQPAEALELLEKARSKFKLNFVQEFYTGVALAMTERWTEAISHLTSAELIAKTSEPSRLTHTFYYQLGSAYERSGNLEEAVKALRKALEISPQYADALNYLGYMWAERGENLDEARSMVDRALQSEPENAAFLDSMAWVLFKLKQPEEALKYMNKAIAHSDKPDPTLLEHLGDIQADLKQLSEARDSYSRSLALKPDEKIRQKLEQLRAKPNP